MARDPEGRAAGGRVLRLFPSPCAELPPEDVYSDLAFPDAGREGSGRRRAYVAVNMVCTLDGRAAVGGRSSPIGSEVDGLLMRNIRCAFDAVLVGAGTVRAEEMDLGVPGALSEKRRREGLPDHPLGVVLAGSRSLPLERRIFGPRAARPPVVVAGEGAPEATLREASRAGIEVLRLPGHETPRPRDVLAALSERFGASRILLEGGPTVNGAFLSARLVDELFMTLSPKIFGSPKGHPEPAIISRAGAAETPHEFRQISAHSSPEHGELYLRYAAKRRPAPPRISFR